ncbi:MAG: FtsQ-type POTRA domain-containing protein [Candidatus Moraniibacteriota bacterium]
MSPKKTKTGGHFLWRAVAILFVGTVVYTLFFSPYLIITNVKILGLEKLSEEPIRNRADNKLREKYFSIIPKNNLLLFPKIALEQELTADFKRIEKVSVRRIFPHTLEVAVKERKLVMLFCAGENCYTLNEFGVSYPANNFTQSELAEENLIILRDLASSQLDQEEKPLEDGFREFVLGLAPSVQTETNLGLKKTYETNNRMSGDVRVETEDGFSIYFNQGVSLKKSVATLRAILEHKIEKERQKDLEYIDLRIADKVFYKFKDGSVQTEVAQNTPAVPATVPETKKEEKKKK